MTFLERVRSRRGLIGFGVAAAALLSVAGFMASARGEPSDAGARETAVAQVRDVGLRPVAEESVRLVYQEGATELFAYALGDGRTEVMMRTGGTPALWAGCAPAKDAVHLCSVRAREGQPVLAIGRSALDVARVKVSAPAAQAIAVPQNGYWIAQLARDPVDPYLSLPRRVRGMDPSGRVLGEETPIVPSR